MTTQKLRRAIVRLIRRDLRPRLGLSVIADSSSEAANLPESVDLAIAKAIQRGIAVQLMLLDFSCDGAPAAANTGVAVRKFWREATPDVGSFVMTNEYAPAHSQTGCGEWENDIYADGLPMARWDKCAAGRRLDHLTSWGALFRRHEMDDDGRLVRIVDVDPHTGEDVTHRYVANDGTCWLSVPLHAGNKIGPVRQFKPVPKTYSTLEEMQASWIRGLMAEGEGFRVRAAGTTARRVVSLLRNGTS